MMNGDRAIGPLFKIILVISVLLSFGIVLNSIASSHERKLSEKEKSMGVRISLVREEYERKISDLKEKQKISCDQKVAEVVSFLKRTAKEVHEKVAFEHSSEIKNKTDEITELKSLLRKYTDKVDITVPKRGEREDAISAIEKELEELKKVVFGHQNEMKSRNSDGGESITQDEAKYYIADKQLLAEVTKKLEDIKKKNETT